MFKLLISSWINLWMPCFFGIGEGPSSSEYNQAGEIGNVGNFATSTGEADISKASDFWSAVLSGDQTQLSKVLGPEYSNISQRGGQELKTTQEFGTRSGGTAAVGATIGEQERAQASQLEGNLVGQAASNLGNMGSGLLSTGLSAHEAAFTADQTIQQQKQQKLNDIFKSIADVGLAPFTGGASLAGFAGGGGGTGGGGGAPPGGMTFSWPFGGSSAPYEPTGVPEYGS